MHLRDIYCDKALDIFYIFDSRVLHFEISQKWSLLIIPKYFFRNSFPTY